MGKLSKIPRGDLSKYDPDKGIKTIRILEAAEKHWMKARDAQKLETAIRSKLEAQSEFVLWWDTNGPGANHGGKREKAKT